MSKTTLDSIILRYRAELNQGLNELAGRGTPEEQMRQALTSLFKELVAEAEPINEQGEIDIDVPAYNDGYYSGANNTLEKFKQNLLKALEEK